MENMEMRTQSYNEGHLQSKLQSPKAVNNYNALAGLLTYSPFVLPSHPELKSGQWPIEWTMVMELTAAGQLRNYTIFPFNS